MSMIGCFRATSDADIEAVLDRPERVEFLLYGEYSQEGQADEWEPESESEEFDVDKAWDGLHYLLTTGFTGDVASLSFILSGGSAIGDIDVGYGPARAFSSAEVSEIAAALAAVSAEDLRSRYDARALGDNDVYPVIWDEPDACDYLLEYFDDLKDFIAKSNAAGMGLVVWLS